MMRIHRLQSKKSFRVLFRLGKRKESEFFKCIELRNQLPFSRFAYIIPKVVDKRSVVRNRLRRRSREWMRTHLSPPAPPIDFILFIKKEAAYLSREEFYSKLATFFAICL